MPQKPENARKTTLCVHAAIATLATQQLHNVSFQLIALGFANFNISGINFSTFGDWLLEGWFFPN